MKIFIQDKSGKQFLLASHTGTGWRPAIGQAEAISAFDGRLAAWLSENIVVDEKSRKIKTGFEIVVEK